MADTVWIEAEARRLFAMYRLDGDWHFHFDRATTRLGQCDHRKKRITVSRHLTAKASEYDVTQVLLHEIAHALAGARAAHGPRWKAISQDIGYLGGRTHNVSPAHEHARWIGRCEKGHEIIRFRKPGKPVSCARCDRRFNSEYLITWEPRT